MKFQVSEAHITEVGMRDGLQMEKKIIPTEKKIELGKRLITSGVKRIEATSFVSPKAIPQLFDAKHVVSALREMGATITSLVPNKKGAEKAIDAGSHEITVFISASETHNMLNINSTIEESLLNINQIAMLAENTNTKVCGAVATSFGCPFEGNVPLSSVLRIIEGYVASGINHITLGDTTGMATPPIVTNLCNNLREKYPEVTFSLHFHNTRGLGLVNVIAGLNAGITHYESSFGGLGGCPFAAGASGNICTEDLVNLFNELEIPTGISLEELCEVSRSLEGMLDKTLPGQIMKSGPRSKLHFPASKFSSANKVSRTHTQNK